MDQDLCSALAVGTTTPIKSLPQMLCAREGAACSSLVTCPTGHHHSAGLKFTAFLPAACSYAARARKIKNKPTKNTNQLSKLREEMAALREENRRLQVRTGHWEVKPSLLGHVKQKHVGWPSAAPAQPSL